jgi:large subunit ribosomal protein L14
MIQNNSWLKVTDNTGANFARCVRVYRKGKQNAGYLGDLILVVPKEITMISKRKIKLKAGSLYKAIIVRTKLKSIRQNGFWRSYADNATVLFGNAAGFSGKSGLNLLAKRIYGAVSYELRRKGHSKLVSLARRVT